MKIFLSAVTPELGSYREAITRELHGVDFPLRVQEYFRPDTATLLDHLCNHIRDCGLAIFLVGERCGAFPKDHEVTALGRVEEFEKYRAATGQTRASYTQWEYFLAHHYAKPRLVFMTTDGFVPDKPNDESPESSASQQAFRQWIKDYGPKRTPLTTEAQLEKDVLRYFVPKEPLALAPRPMSRPQNLLHATLGNLFKGREQFVRQLKESLARTAKENANGMAKPHVVHGLGGLGKTRVVLEYAWQHATDYTALLFVTADSPEDLRRNLAGLVAVLRLKLPKEDAQNERCCADAALCWLEEHPGWFLILDNVDTPEAREDVQKHLPRLRQGCVVITSRLAQWSASVEPFALDVLRPKASIEFLLARTEKHRRKTADDDDDAESLAKELDGLALALEQAGAYIAHEHCSIGEYLNEWQRHDASVQEWFNKDLMNYPKSVAVTWETTLEKLGRSEIAVLRLFAWFAPDPIPPFVLEGEKAATVWQGVQELLLRERQRWPEDLVKPRHAEANLVNYGMARFTDAGDLIIHRVVQEILRNRMPSEWKRDWALWAVHLVRGVAPYEPEDVETWPRWDRLIPHAVAVAHFADMLEIPHPTAQLMSSLGRYYNAKALYSESEPWLRRALILDEKTFEKEPSIVAIHLNNLAILLQDTNRLVEAEPLLRRALALNEEEHGPESQKITGSLNNLAQLLSDTNRLDEAEHLMRRVLAITESCLGPNHPETARNLNNLGLLLYETNRLVEAEPLLLRALTIGERNYGQRHPRVGYFLINLGGLFRDTGRLVEAEPLLRRAFAIFEERLGPEHPTTARCVGSLALLHYAMDHLSEAEPLLRRALAISQSRLGKDHRDVAILLNYLGQLLLETDRTAEAEPLIRQALDISQRSLGPRHPQAAGCMENLGMVLQAMGRLSEAEPLLRQALLISEESLGSENSQFAGGLSNLARLLQATDRIAQAEPLMRWALEIMVKSLSPHSPRSRKISSYYATLLQANGLSPEEASKAVAEVMAAAARKDG